MRWKRGRKRERDLTVLCEEVSVDASVSLCTCVRENGKMVKEKVRVVEINGMGVFV